MAYQSLYRKYRPSSFDQVVGQEAIVKALTNSIKMNRISHAYLFTGPRGTGKTTVAKLYAAAINCEHNDDIYCGTCENCKQNLEGTHPDVIEIDAASNNGVDEIRSLIEKVKFTPILGRFKVYIIDEVHMLSQGAFNALLKTLEEPPEHVVFILATTEIHKVIPTIISRCQRYDFKHISNREIEKQLDYVLEEEGKSAEKGVNQLIATLSAGGMRNALTILEQAFIINEDSITLQSLYDNYGLILPKEKIALFDALKEGNTSEALNQLNRIMDKSVDLARLLMDIITSFKDSLLYDYTKTDSFINLNEKEFILYLSNHFTVKTRNQMIEMMLDRYDKLRTSLNQETHFELAILSLMEQISNTTLKDGVVTSSSHVSNIKEATPSKQDVPEVKPEVLKLEEEKTHNNEEVVTQETQQVEEELSNPNQNIVQEEQKNSYENQPNIPVQTNTQTTNIKLDLTTEEIVQFMVSADKEMRVKEEPVFKSIMRYASDLKWARVSRLLMNTQLVLSGKSFIVVATQRQAQSREIMEERNVFELIEFMEELLNRKKQVFAITPSDFAHAVEKFKIDTQQNTLPAPLNDEDFVSFDTTDSVTEEKDETIERVLDLFGDRVNIE